MSGIRRSHIQDGFLYTPKRTRIARFPEQPVTRTTRSRRGNEWSRAPGPNPRQAVSELAAAQNEGLHARLGVYPYGHNSRTFGLQGSNVGVYPYPFGGKRTRRRRSQSRRKANRRG